MDTRDVAAEYRMAQWAQMIQTRIQSGQSIKEFCALNIPAKNRQRDRAIPTP
jgi:putative transposase